MLAFLAKYSCFISLAFTTHRFKRFEFLERVFVLSSAMGGYQEKFWNFKSTPSIHFTYFSFTFQIFSPPFHLSLLLLLSFLPRFGSINTTFMFLSPENPVKTGIDEKLYLVFLQWYRVVEMSRERGFSIEKRKQRKYSQTKT